MTGDVKLIIKNGALLSIAPYLPQALNIILLPIMTKYLTDVDFGISGTIGAYSSAISVFMLLGLNVIINNSFFKYPSRYKWIWRQIYGFLSIWMIAYAFIQAVILHLFIPVEAQDNKWLIIILANFSTVFFGPTGTLGSTYYMNSKQAFPVVWRSVVASLLTVIVDFVLIVYFRLGYLGWYVGTFAGTFFTNVSYWYVLNIKLGIRPIYNFKWRTIKHALKVGIPTIPHFYSNYLLEGAGRVVMDQNGIPQGEIGRSNIAQTFGNFFNNVIQGGNQALSPFFMESIKNNNEGKLKKIGYAYTFVTFIAAFLLAIWSKEIFDFLLSNNSLKSAYPYFIIYVMALCYRPLYSVASTYYFYYEKTTQLLLITFITGCIAFLLYLILIPMMGVWGFLIGRYVACLYYGYSGFYYITYRKYAGVKIHSLPFFVLQLLLTGAAWILVDYLLWKILATVVLLMTILYIIVKYKRLFVK